MRLARAVVLSILVAGCGSSPAGSSTAGSPSPSEGASPRGAFTPDAAVPPGAHRPGACLTTPAATAVWNDVRRRLSAVQLDPAHAGLASVATGIAASDLGGYMDRQLVAQHVTEREVDRLDGLTVVTDHCSPTVLVADVHETLVTDDYLGPGGRVDHSDPAVGSHLHLQETFVQVGTTWKISDQTNLDLPPASIPPLSV